MWRGEIYGTLGTHVVDGCELRIGSIAMVGSSSGR